MRGKLVKMHFNNERLIKDKQTFICTTHCFVQSSRLTKLPKIQISAFQLLDLMGWGDRQPRLLSSISNLRLTLRWSNPLIVCTRKCLMNGSHRFQKDTYTSKATLSLSFWADLEPRGSPPPL